MPNNEKLKETIKDSGMTMIAISKKSGIEKATIYNRLNGRGEWTASEIVGMTKALKMDVLLRDEIFLT